MTEAPRRTQTERGKRPSFCYESVISPPALSATYPGHMCPFDEESATEQRAGDTTGHASSHPLDNESGGDSDDRPLNTRLLSTFGATAFLSAAAVAGACLAGSVWVAAGSLLLGGLLVAGLSAHVTRTVGPAGVHPEGRDAGSAHDPAGGEGERMQALTQLMSRTSGEGHLEESFRTFLREVREATDATYAALSIFDDDGDLAEFFTLGLTEAQKEEIGRPPEGEGLLGYIHEQQGMLHLDDMAQHSESVGFPDGHPPMQSLLAAPITYQGRPLGNLYLSDKEEVITFSEADAQFVESASEAAAVLINEKEVRLENERVRQELRHETEAIASILDRLADGDLTVDIPQDSDDEDIARVWDRLQGTVGNLRQMVEQVQEAAESTSASASQISASSDQMAASAEEQSAQAEEVAAAVEELNQTINENAKSVQRTAEAAQTGGEEARRGGDIVGETTEKMEEIAEVVDRAASTIERLGESSEEIGRVVDKIDEIAEQTNLLALNAAIEAARAGEEGKGFAVVAEEVRDLAEEADAATDEVAEMIGQVQSESDEAVERVRQGTERVDEGLELAGQAGDALEAIVDAIEEVEERADEIAAASEQQSTTSEEIARSIQSISTAARESAAGVTQVSGSADELEGLTERLRRGVQRFTLEAETESAQKRPSETAPQERASGRRSTKPHSPTASS